MVQKKWSYQAWWTEWLRQEVCERFKATESDGAVLGAAPKKGTKRRIFAAFEDELEVVHINVDNSDESEGECRFEEEDS